MRVLLTGILVFIFSALVKAQTDVPPPPPPEMKHNNNRIFDSVEVEAGYPGGDAAWRQYLVQNFRVDSVTDLVWKQLPNKDKRKKGLLQITAIVQFVVSQDGTVSDIRTLNKVPAAFKEEAERLVAASKLWTPAQQNGRLVKAYRKQPITMQIEVE